MNDRSAERRDDDLEQAVSAGLVTTCPECSHDAVGTRNWLGRLVGRVRGRPVRPTCPTMMTAVESDGGMPGPCCCTHSWHA